MHSRNFALLASLLWLVYFPLGNIETLTAQDQANAYVIRASTDREDALYRVGETATFMIDVALDGKPLLQGDVDVILSKDGVEPQIKKTIPIENGKGSCTGTLSEPGFLLMRVSSGKATALASAGFDPLKILPSLPPPDDFDAFWNDQKVALGKVPLNPRLTSVESPNKEIEAFDLQVDCLGAPVSGYFGRPKNAKPKTLPAILLVHGAGVGSASLGSIQWAGREAGMLSLDINAHGIPNGKSADFYKSLNEGELKDYRSQGRSDRETCYFKGMFLRLIRAIDFLTEQPEWDGKTVIVYGSSQGGFQAFAAAGLDSRVSFFCAGVPAGCDHTGSVVHRINGWPKIVPKLDDGSYDPKVLEVARYFDCVNFATRARSRGAAVTVGWIDTTCPPTSVYAAYNALKIPRHIHVDILAGHTNTPAASKFMQEAALNHVREMSR